MSTWPKATPSPTATPSPRATPSPGLGAVARRGVVWQALAFGAAKLTLLLSTVVLARTLGPDEYGFVALAAVLVLSVTVVSDLGASQALVYLPRSPRRLGAAVVLGLTGSTLLALVWVGIAPTVAAEFGHAGEGAMVATLAPVIVLTSFGMAPDAILRKDLRFARRLPAEVARGVTRAGVAIGLVLNGVGPWSLVWGEVAGATAYAVTSWVMAAPELAPGRTWFDHSEHRALLSFGLPAALNGALATAALNVDYVIIGAALGTTAVGIYLVGFRIPEMLVLSVFQVFSQVAFPVYARLQDDVPRLARGYLLSLRVQALYGFTVGATIAALSPTLVPVLFGDQYADAVPVMQAIAAYVVFRSLAAGAVDLYKAVGKPQYGVLLGVARLVVLVPVLAFAAGGGVTAVAVAQAVTALVFTVVVQGVACHLLAVSWADLARALSVPGVVAAAAALVAVVAVSAFGAFSEPVVIALAGALAALVAVAVLALLDGALLRRLVSR